MTVTPYMGRPEVRATLREKYQEKLQNIRDQRKRNIVEGVDSRIGEINKNRTAIMLRHLGKIEEVLAKIEARVAQAETNGKDISAVQTAIQKAKDAIAAAKAKIEEQAAKTYTIEITTEDRLGSAVSSVRATFASDLRITHQSVVAARQAVGEVLRTLASIIGEKLSNTTR